MRTVQLPGFDRPVGVLGFGCASLGSRISGRQGLAALAAAADAGVHWFDVAPAYGAGDAEALLGQFARGRRSQVLICTKVGLAPPQRNALLKGLYAAARPVVGLLKGARKAFRRMPATRNVSVPLTPTLIETSLERSLRRLGTDHVDVFALHKPAHADIARDDIVQTLLRLKQAGKVRHLCVAGDLAAAHLAAALPDVYSVFQLADDPWVNPLPGLRALMQRPAAIISHSVLGVDGARERMLAALRQGGAAGRQRLAMAGYGGDLDKAVTNLLVDRAFAANDGGVVLMSMFSAGNRAVNLARAAAPVDASRIALVAELLASSAGVPARP